MVGTNTTPVLSVNGVTKTIGRRNIVDGLTFDIHHGEIVGLLGPNGAGKTTTIRMIVGLIEMSRGDVLVQGHSIKGDFVKAIRHIGGIIENPEFYPYMSGYDNLRQYQRMSDGVSITRIMEIVKLVGLQDAIHKKVRAYSLGMRQRLGIAQALLHNPSILILDEPTNGLDPAGIREMRDYLKRIAREEGIAILVSSHLLSEMELMCSRVVVIQEGKLVTERAIGQAGENEELSTVTLRVNDLELAEQTASRLDGLTRIGSIPDEGALTVRLKEEDIPDLISALCNARVRIYRVEEHKSSLEDEFLKWTGGNRIA
ncbi:MULTISPECIES: ABC transporter ATP-binding protein [Paenibacillus]|uniref:ABC transporter related protein n=1 Tax=Paenibacillus lactis 154 TaxID=743719 RepID=G4HNB0_9BACL|nr:ABC transporter ATP-binding protein [Paenibacillus lactis]EHB54272.1 ABC transporter related protein [Paenibacillus lactis 154]MCM3497133.1 ABC transporter ATP-binding protein [Paenibacillus lactis]GIO94038.1 ABC transporter ATP-binding protein [Paenibacillus lactis]